MNCLKKIDENKDKKKKTITQTAKIPRKKRIFLTKRKKELKKEYCENRLN